MERLRRFILESAFTENFSRAVYEALGIFEAVSINKDFLLKAAGSPEALKEAKARVATAWSTAGMENVVRNGNMQQKLFNFLYLMEIRKPGFVDRDVLTKIHDLAIHGSLDQKFLAKVNSDTKPEEAGVILEQAIESAVQNSKPYPSLTPEEEKVWNRVKVYHEFPDGFRWVYALNSSGTVTGYIPSTITGKTMNHCGNQPSNRAGDEYWELRDASGKAYLTVILNGHGQIEESKSWGNQLNKYRQQILPYVKWLLKDRKVTGVGPRYNIGYATHMNFGVKDFIGDDPEFVDYVIENKPELIGNTESRILFWKGAIEKGVIGVEDLKRAYVSKVPRSKFLQEVPGMEEYADQAKFKLVDGKDDPPDSMFGANSFAVLCASCGENPFTEDELADLIRKKKLPLEVFSNYNIKLLTPRLQEEYVRSDARNLDLLIEISNQVAAFKLVPNLWLSLVPTQEEIENAGDQSERGGLLKRCLKVLKTIETANPPSKMTDSAAQLMSNAVFLKFMYAAMCMTPAQFDSAFSYNVYGESPMTIYAHMATVISKFPDMPLPDGFEKMHAKLITVNTKAANTAGTGVKRFSAQQRIDISWLDVLRGDAGIGSPRNSPLIEQYSDTMIAFILSICGKTDTWDSSYDRAKEEIELLCKLFTGERVLGIANGRNGKRLVTSAFSLAALAATLPDSEDLELVAHEALKAYFYVPVNGKTDYTWNLPDSSSHADSDMHAAMMDMLTSRPNTIRELDWTDKRTLCGVANLIARFRKYKITFPKEGMEDLVVTFVTALHGNAEVAVELWNVSLAGYGIWHDSYLMSRFPDSLAHVVKLYGIEHGIIQVFFREMAERRLADGQSHLVGCWSVFEIPFSEWEEEYQQYGEKFITGYVLAAPADTMAADEYITGFVCDKLSEGSMDLVHAVGWILSEAAYSRQRACLARTITKRILADTMPLEERKFEMLYKARLISAEAYRAVMGRRADRGAIEVTDTPAVSNVIKAFVSIQKMDTLPELIASAVKYLVDTLYANMGDGRFRWKVDENCSTEASLLGTLAAKLAQKAKVGMVPKAIKKLYDDGLVDRIREFPAANRAACDMPNVPKSKITCGALRDVNDTLHALDRVHDEAFAAAERPAGRKAPARRKTAGQ